MALGKWPTRGLSGAGQQGSPCLQPQYHHSPVVPPLDHGSWLKENQREKGNEPHLGVPVSQQGRDGNCAVSPAPGASPTGPDSHCYPGAHRNIDFCSEPSGTGWPEPYTTHWDTVVTPLRHLQHSTAGMVEGRGLWQDGSTLSLYVLSS